MSEPTTAELVERVEDALTRIAPPTTASRRAFLSLAALQSRCEELEERLTAYETPGWINAVQKVAQLQARVEELERERDAQIALSGERVALLTRYTQRAKRAEAEVLTAKEIIANAAEQRDQARAEVQRLKDTYGENFAAVREVERLREALEAIERAGHVGPEALSREGFMARAALSEEPRT